MTYAAAIATQKFGKLVLYRATSQDGRAFYAYLRCDEKGMHRMRRDYESATPCRNAADYRTAADDSSDAAKRSNEDVNVLGGKADHLNNSR